MSDLKKALQVLLYDLFESAVDMELEMDDDHWINYIVNVLIEKNGTLCPFKKYSSVHYCELTAEKCKDIGSKIDCGIEKETVWRHFMQISE